jgi:hypothetical protein
MRYLKTYNLYKRVSKDSKLFESSEENTKHIEMLKSLCYDLTDHDDYSIIFSKKKYLSIGLLSVNISNNNLVSDENLEKYPELRYYKTEPFKYEQIKDCFESMIEYMDGENFEISRIVYSTPQDPASHNWLHYYNDGNLSKYFSGYYQHIEILFKKR